MTHLTRTRRRAFLPVTAAAVLALSGCVSTGATDAPKETVKDAAGPLTIQSRLANQDADALQAVVDAFNEKGSGQVEINAVNNETYREQLPTYLTSENPPDVYTYLGGETTKMFADEGLLLDVSEVWDGLNYTDALRELSQDSEGTEVFIPTSYYWLGVYYDTRVFADAGIEEPATWEEFLSACETLKAQGVAPIGMALSDAPWLASAWFDYLDLRINGTDFHLALLAGEESFDSPEVAAVFEAWDQIKDYFDPTAAGVSFQQGTTDFVQGRTGMFLAGSWLQGSLPPEELKNFDFFQFPIIDEDVPLGEEGPTDGFFASANTDQPALSREFLAYVATAEAQEIMYEATGSGTVLPTNPDAEVELSTFAQEGQAILAEAQGLTQFFNRDAGDDMQPPADQALTQYLGDAAKVPVILSQWQEAAEQVRAGRPQ